jgi:hypothetical protein
LLCKHQVIGSIPIGSTIKHSVLRTDMGKAHVVDPSFAKPAVLAAARNSLAIASCACEYPDDEEKRFAARECGD